MKGSTIFWILLAIVAFAAYQLWQSLANAEFELFSVVQAPINAVNSVVSTVTSELGAFWNYVTGGDTGGANFDTGSNDTQW